MTHSLIPFLQNYFCGQHEECGVIGSELAFDHARDNLKEFFPVVGILEELHTTFKVLEKKLPRFFSEIDDVYHHLNGIR